MKVILPSREGSGGAMTRMLPEPGEKTRPEISSSRDFHNPCEHHIPDNFRKATHNYDDRNWVLEPFSLSGSTGADSFDRIVISLSTAESEGRIAAAEFLGRLGDSRAIEPLFKACMDEDVRVKQAAREALSRIGGRSR